MPTIEIVWNVRLKTILFLAHVALYPVNNSRKIKLNKNSPKFQRNISTLHVIAHSHTDNYKRNGRKNKITKWYRTRAATTKRRKKKLMDEKSFYWFSFESPLIDTLILIGYAFVHNIFGFGRCSIAARQHHLHTLYIYIKCIKCFSCRYNVCIYMVYVNNSMPS